MINRKKSRPWYSPITIFFQTGRNLFRAVFKRKVGWLAIMLPLLLIIAALIVIGSSSGVLAPFLYPLF